GLLILLIVAAYFVTKKSGELSSNDEGSGLMFRVDSAAVDKIELKSSKAEITLEKQGGEWFVVQPLRAKASPSAIARVLEQVKAIEGRSVVSSNPEKYSIFRVDTEGTEIQLWEQKNIIADFILGKMAPSYYRSYIRQVQSHDVVETDVIPSYIFERPVRDWREKTIITALRANIKTVVYQFGDTSFTLVFKDSLWTVGKKKAKQTIVEGIVNTLSNYEADDFLDTSVPKEAKAIAVLSYTGLQIRFMYDVSLKKYYVQSSLAPQWFVVEPWRANTLLKREKELVEK
ncbi:MAG: DUF4340 domain-containing protein, partial [Bacteroidota bacterium]